MIYHESFGQHLRMGNFAFKIGWSIKMLHKYGINTSYPNYYLWEYLKNPPLISPEINGPIVRPIKWEYNQVDESLLEQAAISEDITVALNYFFQSEDWFREYKKEVYEFFTFKEEYINYIKEKYKHILEQNPIGIGIRLGDFVGHGDFYQIPYRWYVDSWKECFSDRKVLVFSDHIEHAKEIFKDYPFVYAEPNGTHTHQDNFKYYHSPKAIEQFVLGTLINDWIIGNSTFSWWQAWLGAFNEGKVIHSDKVFSPTGRMKDCDTSRYYPRWWAKNNIK